MNRLLSWILMRADDHLSDEQIIVDIESAVSGALPAGAGRHLRSCWQCLARRQQLQNITFQIVEYQQAILTPFMPPPPNAEERFLRALDQELGMANPGSAGTALRLWLDSFPRPGVIAAVASAMCLAALLSVEAHRRAAPPMSPVDFLSRATASDHALDRQGSGVMSQRIRIQGSGQTVERTLYRDLQGRRHPRVPAQTPAENRLHAELAFAAVDWNDPLSATSFASWHDRSVVQSDKVSRTGDGLLTLTTTVDDREIASESLTVRQSDFHPVQRTVDLRDAGTVEIAELEYSVSGWNATNEAVFNPSMPASPSAPAAIVLPLLPTPEQLDEAELHARLAIGQDAAAASETLEFTRTGSNIRVHGAVATNERKHELLTRLRAIPHVTASIFSIEELAAGRASGGLDTADSASPPAPSGISPLTALFQQQSRSAKEAAAASRQVLVAMFAVQQESDSIAKLMGRFNPATHLSSTAQGELDQLLAQHRQRLDDALSEEEQLVRPLSSASSSPDSQLARATENPPALAQASAQNRTLCNELVSGSQSSPRAAEAIATDILVSIEDLRRDAATISSAARELSERH